MRYQTNIGLSIVDRREGWACVVVDDMQELTLLS